ncbi:uncharacterized protein LOC117787530 [Drosophila innubila]|uniref:uncharacterized protein LOC117787530 n=1 Tax=Drosophila innubila TaxID=198719 RepID=UPI00148E5169|nr:uncharacterized protein LOC117787530 [Drosophila innubila]
MADAGDEAAPEADDTEETQQATEDKEEDEALQALEENEEEALEEAVVDPFELLDEDTEDNEEQERMYREYLDLTQQIDCQNAIIRDMKDRRNELSDQQCPTRKDRAEIKRLRICIDQESIKLHTMTNRAVQLQNFGSQRLYGDIELPTTEIEETCFVTPPNNRTTCPSSSKSSSKRPQTAQDICDSCDPCNTCDPSNSCNDSNTDSDDTCCP